MVSRPRPYLSYLLRLWLAEDNGLCWRCSLQNPTTAERHGFANLEQLIAFLKAETCELAAQEAWERGAELAGKTSLDKDEVVGSGEETGSGPG